jgi:hypothetical protein
MGCSTLDVGDVGEDIDVCERPAFCTHMKAMRIVSSVVIVSTVSLPEDGGSAGSSDLRTRLVPTAGTGNDPGAICGSWRDDPSCPR